MAFGFLAQIKSITFVNGKYAYILGEGDFLLVGFSMGITFHEEGSFKRVNLYGGILHWEICQNSYTKFLLCLGFSFPTQFYAWRC